MDLRRKGVLGLATSAALLWAAVAFGAPTAIDDVVLEAAAGDAVFFPDDDDTVDCLDGAELYVPAQEGSFEGTSDGFDGGLGLFVEGRPFIAGSEGDLVGEQLTVGRVALGGIQVTRIDRGLPGSPTLRDLVKLKNTTRKQQTFAVTITSDLGSDSSTGIRASSNGDDVLSRADRWVVTSDSAGDPADPPVTHVFHGKGKRVRSRNVAAVGVAEDDCLIANLNVTLAKHATGYLLFFVELAESNQDAIANVARFNRKKLNAGLKAGLRKSVRKQILNWDLAKKKKGKKR